MQGDWTARFQALGLSIPGVLKTAGTDEFSLFTWWQEQAMDGKLLKTDASELIKDGPIQTELRLQAALKKLINDGVVYYNWYSTKDRAKGAEKIGVGNKSLRLKAEYIPKKANEAKFKAAVGKANQGDHSEYGKMAEAVTYADYHKFLNHGYLQLSSNVLHDYFCANGLDVATAEGETPFKIYGDNAMLGKESAKGVKHSSVTSRMSRDSIYELAATGATAKSTQAIAARFPTYVRPQGAAQMSLAEWHGDGGALYKFCFDTVFSQAAGLFSKSTVAAKGELASKASKDDKVEVHSGEAF
jgi:hypothetical protein